MQNLNAVRPVVAARGVGLAEGALMYWLQYARQLTIVEDTSQIQKIENALAAAVTLGPNLFQQDVAVEHAFPDAGDEVGLEGV